MDDRRPTATHHRRDFLVGSAAGVAGMQLSRLAAGLVSKYPEGTKTSYAQGGEDVIVEALFEHLGIAAPTYLDIGAFLPIYSNNTYLFYTRGARGVLVEPNVDLIPELRAKRPGDAVLNVGIGIERRETAPYYRLTLPQWNTFDGDEARARAAKSGGQVRVEQVVPMELIPINDVLAEHFPAGGPDFLSIDVESLDLAILRSMDFKAFRPKIICTETLVHMTAWMDPAIAEFLGANGYEPRGMTFANTIFVDRARLA